MQTTITTPIRSNWMLYGAYGSTGRLILDEALRRGHRPILAGRDSVRLSALGQATGLSTLALPLDDRAALGEALSRVTCVLLAAGPYSLTGEPMRAACLDAGCSYLDISGDIEDFRVALTCDAQARQAGIAVIPGVGYGVVFAECLAAQLALRLPDATWLRLPLATQTAARSRGATLSVAAALAAGGRDISNGTLRKRAIAFSTWLAPAADSPRMRFAAAPLAELLAVQRSTGIANIVAGIPSSLAAAALMRVAGPTLGKFLARQAARPSNEPEPQPTGRRHQGDALARMGGGGKHRRPACRRHAGNRRGLSRGLGRRGSRVGVAASRATCGRFHTSRGIWLGLRTARARHPHRGVLTNSPIRKPLVVDKTVTLDINGSTQRIRMCAATWAPPAVSRSGRAGSAAAA